MARKNRGLADGVGQERTHLYCHACHKDFLALIDYSVDGNHVVECPNCGHEHCRTIKKGVVTGDRWDSREQRVDVDKRSVWKHSSLPAATTTASEFIRQRWLNKEY